MSDCILLCGILADHFFVFTVVLEILRKNKFCESVLNKISLGLVDPMNCKKKLNKFSPFFVVDKVSEKIVLKYVNNYKEDTTRCENKDIELFLVVEIAEKV